MALGAAFSFVIMMFNVPVIGGSTGHAVGATLIAILLGPWAACISVSIALVIQALLFGDGGITAIGANVFNMAFVMPFVGYYVYRLIAGDSATTRRMIVASGIAAYVSIVAGAICRRHRVRPAAAARAQRRRAAALRALPARGRRARDGHRAPAVLRLGRGVRDDGRGRGAREAGQRAAREQACGQAAALAVGGARRARAAHARSACSPQGTAWGEWSAEQLEAEPRLRARGAREARQRCGPRRFPTTRRRSSRTRCSATSFAAIVGAALVIGVTWGIAQAALPRARRRHARDAREPPRDSRARTYRRRARSAGARAGARWLAAPRSPSSTPSPRCSRTTRSPRAPACMQRLDPRVKLLTILLFAVTASFVHSLWVLLGLVALTAGARRRIARCSVASFSRKVWASAGFFALLLSLPAATAWITPGRGARPLGPLSITEPGRLHRGAPRHASRRRRRHRPARRVDDALDRPAPRADRDARARPRRRHARDDAEADRLAAAHGREHPPRAREPHAHGRLGQARTAAGSPSAWRSSHASR